MKERTLDSIQKTALRLLAYTKGGRNRKAEDLASWRTPARFEFLVSDLVTAAGGRSELPEKQAAVISQKLGYTWDDEIKKALSVGLAAYGITLSSEDYSQPDYSTPSREQLLSASKRVDRIKGKPW